MKHETLLVVGAITTIVFAVFITWWSIHIVQEKERYLDAVAERRRQYIQLQNEVDGIDERLYTASEVRQLLAKHERQWESEWEVETRVTVRSRSAED